MFSAITSVKIEWLDNQQIQVLTNEASTDMMKDITQC